MVEPTAMPGIPVAVAYAIQALDILPIDAVRAVALSICGCNVGVNVGVTRPTCNRGMTIRFELQRMP